MLMIVCMLVMMFGAVAQATNAGPITAQYEGYTATLRASCTKTLATATMTYDGNAAIYACGTVRYTSKYNSGSTGPIYAKDVAEDGVGNVTVKYTPDPAYNNVSITAWGKVRTVNVIGNLTAGAGLVK